METSEQDHREDFKLRFAAFAYYSAMLAAFVIGLFGLVSLLQLASEEVQHSARAIGLIL